MRVQALPQRVLARLFQFDGDAQRFARAATVAEDALAQARKVLAGQGPPTGSPRRDNEIYLQTKADFDAIRERALAARAHADVARRVADNCKTWIAQLSDDDVIEVAEPPKLNGQSLPAVRAAQAAIAAELTALRNAPVASADIRERIERYVDGLAKRAVPTISGVGLNQALAVRWPDWATGFETGPLVMSAYLFPERLTEKLLAQVEQSCAAPLPAAARAPRIAELEHEFAELRRIETALVDKLIADGATDAWHDPQVEPSILLGVTVVPAQVRDVA